MGYTTLQQNLDLHKFLIEQGHTDFVRGLVELNTWGEIKVDSKMTTSQPGIYAAGDVADVCPKQVAAAVGAGVSAALSVNEYLESLS
jgi:thioredoxin reductase